MNSNIDLRKIFNVGSINEVLTKNIHIFQPVEPGNIGSSVVGKCAATEKIGTIRCRKARITTTE